MIQQNNKERVEFLLPKNRGGIYSAKFNSKFELLQVAAAEANVPEAPPVDDAPSLSAQAPLILLAILWTQVRTALSPNLIL